MNPTANVSEDVGTRVFFHARHGAMIAALTGMAVFLACTAIYLVIHSAGAQLEGTMLRLNITLAQQVLKAQTTLNNYLDTSDTKFLNEHRTVVSAIPRTAKRLVAAGQTMAINDSMLQTAASHLTSSVEDWRNKYANVAIEHKLNKKTQRLSGLKRRGVGARHSREIGASLAFAKGHVEQSIAIYKDRIASRKRSLFAIAVAGLAIFVGAGLVFRQNEQARIRRLQHRSDSMALMVGFLESAQYLSDPRQAARLLANAMVPDHASDAVVLLREDTGDDMRVAATAGTSAVDASGLDDPTTCPVIKTGQRVVVSESSLERACPCPFAGASKYVCLPLTAQGGIAGLVCLKPKTSMSLSRSDLELAETLTRITSIELSRLLTLHGARREAVTDQLTGVFNRRFLDGFLEKQVQAAKRGSLPLALLMLDVDKFKNFNDRHGHQAGDALLSAFARVLTGCVRDGDLVARYGGEEFTVVLPNTTVEAAHEIAERIRTEAEILRIPEVPAQESPTMTVSIGLAAAPKGTENSMALVGAADAMLYEAKQSGRNCVVAASTT